MTLVAFATECDHCFLCNKTALNLYSNLNWELSEIGFSLQIYIFFVIMIIYIQNQTMKNDTADFYQHLNSFLKYIKNNGKIHSLHSRAGETIL